MTYEEYKKQKSAKEAQTQSKINTTPTLNSYEQYKAQRQQTTQQIQTNPQHAQLAQDLAGATSIRTMADVKPATQPLKVLSVATPTTGAGDTTILPQSAINEYAQKKESKILKTPEIMKDNARRIQDGYDFGDLTMSGLETIGEGILSVGGTVADVGLNALKGVMSVPENMAKAGASVVAGTADLFGADDWANQIRRNVAYKNIYTDPIQKGIDVVDKASVTGEFVDDIASGIGQVGGTVATTYALGKAGLDHVGFMPTTAILQGAGSASTEAYQKADESVGLENMKWQDKLQTAIKIGGGGLTAGAAEGLVGMFGVGGTPFTTKISNAIISKVSGPLAKVLTKMGLSGLGEAGEEFVEYVGNVGLNNLIDKMGNVNYLTEYDGKEIGKEMLSSFIVAALTQGGSSILQMNKFAKQEVNRIENELGRKLTQNEIKQVANNIADQLLLESEKNNAQESAQMQETTATNEVIPQEGVNANTANVVQNTANAQNVAQNEAQIQQSLGIDQQKTQIPAEIQTFIDNRNRTSPGLRVEMDSTINTDGVIIKKSDGTRTMRINPRSTRAYEFVAVHEMLHDLENTEAYRELAKFVNDRALTQEGFEKAKAAITEQYQRYYTENGLDMSKLNMEAETTNDMIAQALGNQEFLNELAGQKPTVFMRIYDWFKNVLFDGRSTGKTFSERRADNKFLQELKKKFEIAYNTAYKGVASEQTDFAIGGIKGVQNAAKNNALFKRLEDNLKRAQHMARNGASNEFIRQNTNWFQDRNGEWKFEFSDKYMKLKPGIKLQEDTRYKLGDILEHDLLFTIYPELENVKVLYGKRSNNINGAYTRKTNSIFINSKLKRKLDIEGTMIHEIQHAIQKIEKFKKDKYNKGDKLNYLKSIQEIEAADTKSRFLKEKKAQLDTNLTPPEVSKTKPKHPELDNYLKNRTIKDKIRDGIARYFGGRGWNYDTKNQSLNTRDNLTNRDLVLGRGRVEELEESSSFSLGENTPATDNKGRELTKEQQEYFRDSKVRDENGNLKVMYHGTDADFNVFSYDFYGKTGTAYGRGFYFIDSENAAESYGSNVKKVYLDIKKPMQIGEKTMSKNDFRNLVLAVNKETNGTLLEDYGGIDDAVMEYEYGGDDIDLTNSIMIASGLNFEKFYRILKSTLGYDGIKANNITNGKDGNIYLAFTPEQIKNVDNTNPTENPDIRYSQSNDQSNDEWAKYLSENWDLMANARKAPTLRQQQAEQEAKRMNLKKPKLEEIAELTAENAQLPKGSYKQKADKMTAYRSKFWENVESSKIIGQNIKDQVNMTNYERKHNDETLAKMKDRLDTDPVKLTQEWWAKDIKKATDQDIALGAILLERYQQEGRFEEAVDVVHKLAEIGTEAGRTVQMYSIFQRLTPEGMQIYQQKKLDSALETLTKKQTGKWVEQNKDKFKLTQDDATFITAKVQEAQNAPTERQKQIALAEIENRINDKLPPEAGQSVKAFRRIAMLFNPKTQVRNIAGNITVMPLNYVSDLVATSMEKAIAKKTGVRTTTVPNTKIMLQGAKKGLAETIDDYKRGVRTTPTGSKYEIQNNAKSFNENTNNKTKNAINRRLNGIDRFLSAVMEAGDRPFYEAAYQNSLQGQMKANNVTEPTLEMIEIASNVALSQTWQDSNELTQAVLQLRSALNGFGHYIVPIDGLGLGDLIIPFAKTPANLTKAIIDYSPLGAVRAAVDFADMKKAISRGDMTPMQQKKFVTSVGKMVAGTLLYTIAKGLVQNGAVTGSSDEDKDVANFEKNVLGIQPYSIKIGDKTFTYNWAQPLATPLAIMADVKEMSEEGAEWNEILVNAFRVAGDQLVANSFLQGIQELLSSGYGDESAMDNLIGAIMDLPTQFTPTLFGQIATYTDPTKRQTYENGDTVGTMINEVKNKIPGTKNTLAPQVNTFGEEIQNYGGDNSAFNVFLNPGNVSSANATDTQKELYALYEATQDTTIFPRQAPYSVSGGGESVKLSSKDRAEYQKASGTYVTEHLDALFDSDFYKSLENEQKAEIVNKIVSDADTIAKSKWVETNTTAQLAEKQEKLENAGIPLVDYYNSWAAQKDIEGIPGPDGKTLSGSKSRLKKEAIDKATADLDKYQRRVLYEMFNIGESVW